MKRIIIIGIIAVIFAGCGGSSSVNTAISQVEKALAKVEKNKGNMTEADWQNLEKEVEAPMQALANALENNKIGAMERIKLATVMTKWSAVVMEAGFATIEKQTGINRENWGSELEKATEGLGKTAEELEKNINVEELEKTMKELEKTVNVEELEKAMKELEKMMNK